MENKTKLRTVREDKWERKEYITTCDSDLVKDIIKIRLHMWELKKNYPREEEDTRCPIYNQTLSLSSSKAEDLVQESPKRKESISGKHIIDVNIILVVRCYVLNV